MINRKLIASEEYRGSTIEARFMGPDLLALVDGVELANFYLNAEAAKAAGLRYVDQAIKEREAKEREAAQS